MISDLQLAYYCQDSYKNYNIRIDNNQAYLQLIDNTQILAIRGTEFNFEDIVRDIRAIPWHNSQLGWCHSGFLKGGDKLYQELIKTLDRDKPLIITGHSLGAALANIIAAKLLINHDYKVEKIITYGSPKVGFKKLSKILQQIPQIRYVNGSDVIPNHPWSLWGYRHTTNEDFIIPKEYHKYKNHRIQEYIDSLK